MVAAVYFITHPDVVIDPAVPIPDWPLSARGKARMAVALEAGWVRGIRSIWTSPERKARDGAEMLAARLGLVPQTLDGLRENDRSSTGYLPRETFEAVARRFFADPAESVLGWERAVDAQQRVVAAMHQALAAAPLGDVGIVAHGGVGALLLCFLLGEPITPARDQPGAAGGNVFAFGRGTLEVVHAWRGIDAG